MPFRSGPETKQRETRLPCVPRTARLLNTKKRKAPEGNSGAFVEVEDWLEDELGSDLDLPGTGGAVGPGESGSRHAKCARSRDSVSRLAELRVVKEVEELEAQLKFGALGDGSVLQQGRVYVDFVRTVEEVLGEIWLLIVGCQFEGAEGRPCKGFVDACRLSRIANDGGSCGQTGVIAVAIAEDVVGVTG